MVFPQSVIYRYRDVDELLNRELLASVIGLIILKAICYLTNEFEVDEYVPLASGNLKWKAVSLITRCVSLNL